MTQFFSSLWFPFHIFNCQLASYNFPEGCHTMFRLFFYIVKMDLGCFYNRVKIKL